MHFPNRAVALTSASADRTRGVVRVSSDINPGIYYLIDEEKNQISPLGRYWSKTSYSNLAPMQVIDFKNRHGDDIQSYFTKAVGKR